MDLYQQYIAMSRYARWIDGEERRENWLETVDRYIEFFKDRVAALPKSHDLIMTLENDVRPAIANLEVMPSMRCLMSAGRALEKDNVAGYNCSYVAIDHVRSFDEILYILMCGTGVGFSVERQYIVKLPEVAEDFHETDTCIRVPDSKIGWAKSFRELIALLYQGQLAKWDMSAVRPAGARLKTFGGRSSGPEPLNSLFEFTVNLFKRAAGRKLTSIECHDLVCKIAEIVVVGGVRRSALISLSNLSDDRMRSAKNGQWWATEPQRALANNSAVYTERPEFETFMREWMSLYESKAGERGIFSRKASKNAAAKNGRRDTDYDFGTNPCSEIILRSGQFCNLSEVVIRSKDTFEDLARKVRIATILGTLQSTLTDLRYLRKVWTDNTAEERLLGVSLTGICDHAFMSGKKSQMDGEFLQDVLWKLREVAIKTNEEWAQRLGIEQSTAITCVKPSGTVSQLVDSASGIHPRFAPYYIRRVRGDKKDPMTQFMIEQGFPVEDDVMNKSTVVFSFPVKAPKGSVYVDEVSAMDQLQLWETYQKHWCEHKPSVTIYYSNDEFLGVGQWVWEHIEDLSGISFLPRTDHVYQQAPYEAISEEQYKELLDKMPKLKSWEGMKEFEKEDMTTGSKELACVAGVCEIV